MLSDRRADVNLANAVELDWTAFIVQVNTFIALTNDSQPCTHTHTHTHTHKQAIIAKAHKVKVTNSQKQKSLPIFLG